MTVEQMIEKLKEFPEGAYLSVGSYHGFGSLKVWDVEGNFIETLMDE